MKIRYFSLTIFLLISLLFVFLSAQQSSASTKFRQTLQKLEYLEQLPGIENWIFLKQDCGDFTCIAYYRDPASLAGQVRYGALFAISFKRDGRTQRSCEINGDVSRKQQSCEILPDIVFMKAWNFTEYKGIFNVGTGDRAVFDGDAWYFVPHGWATSHGIGLADGNSLSVHYVVRGQKGRVIIAETYQDSIARLAYINIKIENEQGVLVVEDNIDFGSGTIIRTRTQIK